MRAAAAGRAAYEEYLDSAELDLDVFTPADQAALSGEWSWMGRIARRAMAGSPAGWIDDELAYVTPWGFAPEQVEPAVLFLHGGQDRLVPSAHSAWLARHCPAAELWLRPDDGHVSILGSSAVAALDWLTEHTRH
jgi:pimeloyl-ACP methyl ester carboxylesterase